MKKLLAFVLSAVLLLVYVSQQQDETIETQRALIRAMQTNPACMVARTSK